MSNVRIVRNLLITMGMTAAAAGYLIARRASSEKFDLNKYTEITDPADIAQRVRQDFERSLSGRGTVYKRSTHTYPVIH